MLNLNKAMLIGNLTKDPELRYTPAGQSVMSFTVATNRRWKDKVSGEMKENAEFHDIVAWGKLAENISQILGKGQKVYVEGRLQTRSWEGNDGAKRTKTEIIAENVIALERSKEGAPSSEVQAENVSQEVPEKAEDVNQEAPAEKEPKAKKETSSAKTEDKKPKAADEGEEEINLDDIPF